MPETRRREVRHNNGIHVYEGFVSIVENGEVVYRHEAKKYERGDIVCMFYDDVSGRIAYTFNGVMIYMSPPPELVPEPHATAKPQADELDWQDTLDID